MPTKQFLNLETEKQNNIIQVSIAEFSQYGYENASTNRIVKKCDISKGSLFKYFSSKEDLYFFLLDTVTAEMIHDMESGLCNLSKELFQRIIDYSVWEISWYIKNPIKGQLVIGAAVRNDTEIYRKTVERYGIKGDNIYRRLLEDVDERELRRNKSDIADILKWVLEGFNKDFLDKIDLKDGSFEQFKEEYVNKLTGYINILKEGF